MDGNRYRIKGTKCWISSGDNDLGCNVIHLVLARGKGDPDGAKGLSLFVVPKINVNADGSLGEPNDVTLVSIEDKMGIARVLAAGYLRIRISFILISSLVDP